MNTIVTREPHRTRLVRTADWLAVAVAASLPLSTSATGILIAIWAVLLIPVLDWRELRAVVMRPAGGLPVLLVLLGIAGTLWAGVSWGECWEGLGSFLKLLAIPLLFVQFRRSERGLCVFSGFLLACIVLLVIGTLAEFVPGFSFIPMKADHVLVKNAATQSGEFVLCIFGLLFLTFEFFERRHWVWLFATVAAAIGMFANIVFVATGRTALVMALVLLVALAAKRLRARGSIILAVCALTIGALAWSSSPYLRDRTTQIWTDYEKYEATDQRNSSGERVEFWRKSVEFVRAAPLIGHGTGSIHRQFAESSVGNTGAAGVASTNPHNQTLAVAIQLGLVGAVVLWAMWIAHLFLFRGSGLAPWVGLIVVLQNIVGSLFNSHLFDFGQGWIYVFGAGVAGGMALKDSAPKQSSTRKADVPFAKRASRIELPARPRILVIALRRLGDVLLTTPLIASLRRAFPDAVVDALVFDDTAGILQGNTDIDGIVKMPARRGAGHSLWLAMKLWRQYDLAASTQSGDRPTYFAIIAGRQRAAPVEARFGGRIKRRFLARSVDVEKGVHRVEEMLRLADALGIEREPRVVTPQRRVAPQAPAGRYAVIHATPKFRYKQWTIEGWRALAAALIARGLKVVATGGPSREERDYLDSVWAGSGVAVTRLDGMLDWSQLSGLLGKARVYIGPDTSVTHLAAASGCPTVALYGPTDPRLWAPWPAGGATWDAAGSVQQRGNVWLVQNPLPCMPCQLEGCERRLGSYSACLDELSPAQVIGAVEQALRNKPVLVSSN